MSSKHGVAVSIEHSLESMLNYTCYDHTNPEFSMKEKRRAIEDCIGADFFDLHDNVEYLKKAIARAVDLLEITPKEKKSLKSTIKDLETIPFENAAEYWELIVSLFVLLSKK